MVKRKIILDRIDELSSPLFTTEWGRKSSVGVLILSAGLLLYTLIGVVMDWYSNIQALHHSRTALAPVETNFAELVSQIPDWHLFGNYGALKKNAHLPITGLQIELTGIIKATPSVLSRVIITEGGKPGKIYQAGDTLESGVRVYAIMNDGVVLENGGQLEKLPLRRTPLQFQEKFKPIEKMMQPTRIMKEIPDDGNSE
jgi:type II secretory pathway component PulC